MTEVVREYIVRGRHFTIVNKDGWFCAIEDKYIDEDGRMKVSLNGLQMNSSRELDQCLRMTKAAVDMSYYKEQGLSDPEIFEKLFA